MSNTIANAGFSVNRSSVQFLDNLNVVNANVGVLNAPLAVGAYKRMLYEGWSSTVTIESSGATGVNLWNTFAGTAALTLPYLSVIEEAQITLATGTTSLAGPLAMAVVTQEPGVSTFAQVMFTGIAPATINAGPLRTVVSNSTNTATAIDVTGTSIQLVNYGVTALTGRVKVVLSVLVPR